MNKILSKKEAEEKGRFFHCYKNGNYKYQMANGLWCLIKNKKNVLAGIQAIDCDILPNGGYVYQLANGKVRLERPFLKRALSL